MTLFLLFLLWWHLLTIVVLAPLRNLSIRISVACALQSIYICHPQHSPSLPSSDTCSGNADNIDILIMSVSNHPTMHSKCSQSRFWEHKTQHLVCTMWIHNPNSMTNNVLVVTYLCIELYVFPLFLRIKHFMLTHHHGIIYPVKAGAYQISPTVAAFSRVKKV